MKQAQAMQSKMEALQKRLEDEPFEGFSGGGKVKIVVNGKGAFQGIKIMPEVIDPSDPEMLEDLIHAAWNEAKKNAEGHAEQEMAKLSGSLGLPSNFKMPF